jgi:hypothetical protein
VLPVSAPKPPADRQALKDREATLQQHEKDSAAGKKIFEHRKVAFGQREDLVADRKALDDRKAALVETDIKRSAEWDKKIE